MALHESNVRYWELIHGSNKGYHRSDDYSARCDVCGDSSTNKSKKRLHLYRKTSYDEDSIKCFNCGYTGNMFSYIKNYHPEFYDSYKSERGFGALNKLKNDYLEVRKIQPKTDVYTFTMPSEFIEFDTRAKDYVESRKIAIEALPEYYYSEGQVQLGDKVVHLKDYLIIPLLLGDKAYGFYSRSTKTKTFYTYIPEQNTGYKVWNWFNISKKDTVYVFEAIFNALSTNLPNSIACMGSDLPEERLKELEDVVFLFDNDSTGREKALKYALLGYKVFIYPNTILEKDFNDLLKGGYTKDGITDIIKANICSSISAIVQLKMKL